MTKIKTFTKVQNIKLIDKIKEKKREFWECRNKQKCFLEGRECWQKNLY